jgi:hypothetical protein
MMLATRWRNVAEMARAEERLYGADNMDWHVSTASDARRLQAQRR